jgi:hypothetical protein
VKREAVGATHYIREERFCYPDKPKVMPQSFVPEEMDKTSWCFSLPGIWYSKNLKIKHLHAAVAELAALGKYQ